MLRLMLLRHAKAERPEGIDDHDRPLAERGGKAARRMGQYMAGAGLVPDLVLVSSSTRTVDTWKAARPAFTGRIEAREDPRLYNASAAILLKIVQETHPPVAALIVIGHLPGLQDFALELIGNTDHPDWPPLRDHFPTAALAVIDFDDTGWGTIAPGKGALERFVTPKLLDTPG